MQDLALADYAVVVGHDPELDLNTHACPKGCFYWSASLSTADTFHQIPTPTVCHAPPGGSRQVFAAVAKTDTAIAALIQRSLAEVGQAQETGITAFTDGCSGLRSILVDAGITKPPYLDWFRAT